MLPVQFIQMRWKDKMKIEQRDLAHLGRGRRPLTHDVRRSDSQAEMQLEAEQANLWAAGDRPPVFIGVK